MIRFGRVVRLGVATFLLLAPSGASPFRAAAMQTPDRGAQSGKKTNKKKAKPKSRQKILKGKHERHRRRPA